MANALSPDISFVTETLFRARAIRWSLHWRVEPAAGSAGVWGCNGNHEIYAGVEDEANGCFAPWMRLLRAAAVVVEHNGAI